MVNLTELGIKALKPPERGQKDYFDDDLAGFGIRVSQGGARSFFLFVGSKHNRQRRSLGKWGIITLSQARNEAKRLLAEHTLGKVRPHSITYPEGVELFLEEKGRARRSRTVADYKRLLNRFGFKGQLIDLTHPELQRRLKRFTSPGEYNHLLVALKIFFNWAIKRRYIEQNPTLGLSTHSTVSRTRVLSDAELKAIWEACDGTFGILVKLLIVTGQRRGEIAALRWEWVDEESRTISFPASLTKNGRAHTIPFGKIAYEVLDSLGSPTLLFPARGKDTPFNGWSKSKATLDKLTGIANWTLHDLRRTFATNMAQLGTAPHVVEKLLNHRTGTISGVAAIYNRYQFMDEMRQAIEKYDDHLVKILQS